MSFGFSLFMWVGIAATVAALPFFTPAVARMIEIGLHIAHAALVLAR
jgi:hypothetical protein